MKLSTLINVLQSALSTSGDIECHLRNPEFGTVQSLETYHLCLETSEDTFNDSLTHLVIEE